MKPPVCHRCGGHGLILMEQIAEDGIGPAGRRVGVAYRCECSAGAAKSARFALAPPAEGRPQLSLVEPRKDIDG
jgi:hypothetical protein